MTCSYSLAKLFELYVTKYCEIKNYCYSCDRFGYRPTGKSHPVLHRANLFRTLPHNFSVSLLEAFVYVSTLGSFLWLNAMGYYIWRTFKSRNVFLRITDGRKYCYYSLYVWGCTLTMGGMALFAHLILDARHDNVNKNYPSSETTIEGAIGKLLDLLHHLIFSFFFLTGGC